MKKIKKEIEQCMLDFSATEGGVLNARFMFPEDFIGFQGHFPGNKILPGICQIQCVIAMIEKWKGGSAVLKEIILAKFLSPVFPSEELACTGSNIEEGEGELIFKALFSKGNKKIAEMKLKVRINQNNADIAQEFI